MTRKTTLIRKAIASELLGLGVFTKVWDAPRDNITDASMPCAHVAILSGEFDNGAEEVFPSIQISIVAKSTGGIPTEDVLDDLAEVVENNFTIGSTLGSLVEYMNPESFSYAVDLQTRVGMMVLTFNAKYEVE